MTTDNFPKTLLTDPIDENGDLYDEDTGDFYGTLDLKATEPTLEEPTPPETVPAQFCLFLNGFWYIYKMDSRYEEGEKDA